MSGFRSEAGQDGSEAVAMVEKAEAGYYDVVSMNIQMPVGCKATQAIRPLSSAMTANAFGEDRRAALDAGMNGHIAKPINIPTLLITPKRIFSSQGGKK